jgi:AraC-like DNA-binding protein
MHYAEVAPSPALAAVVACFWFLEAEGSGTPESIIPDGRIEIVFHYGVHFEQHGPDGRVTPQPASLMVGQMLAPIGVGYRGHAAVAAIRLRPAAAGAVLRCSAAEVTGQVLNLDDVFGPTGSLRDRLSCARDDRGRARLLEQWLAKLVSGSPSREVEGAVRSITASRGRVGLEALARDSGLSVRQLERRFLADVGLAPKPFARTVRLQSALRRIGEGHSLADVAVDCGYYDQPHMTRDFAGLARTSPAAWRQYSGSLAPLFVGR